MQDSILVTGASGFVGKHLITHLHTNAENQASQTNIIGCARKKIAMDGIQTLQIGDINAETDWSHCLHHVHTVIHCAARVHVMQEREADPLTAFRQVNVAGTLQLATQAAQAGVKQFIFLSSVKVNGEYTLPNQAFTETDKAQPQDAYGASKWEAEQALFALGKRTGMAITIIRPPLVYGKGVGGNFLSMLRFVQKQIPLPLANIHNQRSLIYVGNLVHFIGKCIQNPAAFQQVFLISDDHDLSTPELLRQVAHTLHTPSRLFSFPVSGLLFFAKLLGKKSMADRLCQSLQVDIKKARSILDWQPPFTPLQGLTEAALTLANNSND